MMKMSPVFFALYVAMFNVVVCEATSYGDAFGKTKDSSYRGGANIADQNHSNLEQCNVDSPFFRELINKNKTEQRAVQQKAYQDAWSGTQKDLHDVVANAKKQYGFENLTHLGRNATMAVPASLTSMVLEMNNGNPNGWKVEGLAYFHQPGTTTIFGPNIKFTNSAGDEVVYNRDTKRIVPDQYMGTKNFEQDYMNNAIDHSVYDISPHFVDNNYKYVGILYERDMQDPDKFYIIDGQTGLPMNPKQVADFPTTLSDMWKEMGPSCAKSDSKDVKSRYAPLKAFADGMKQGWEMGGPIGAIGGAVGGGVAAGHIVSIENKQKSGTGVESQQVQTSQHEPVQSVTGAIDGIEATNKELGICLPPSRDTSHSRISAISVDISKLEALLKEDISLLKNLIAKGERATSSQIDAHNRRVEEVVDEWVNIAKQIESLNVSEEEKKSIGEKVLAKVNGLNSQLGSLIAQAKSMGLVNEVTTEQKREILRDVQGKLTAATRDAEKAKDPSDKAKGTSQGRTMTD